VTQEILQGVWHLAQDPSGGADCILDSTTYGNHGTPEGSMGSEDLVDAINGKGLNFDGTDDAVVTNSNSAMNISSGDITYETIVNCDYPSEISIIIRSNWISGAGGNSAIGAGMYTSSNSISLQYRNTAGTDVSNSANPIVQYNDYYLASVRDTTVAYGYRNGIEVDSSPTSGADATYGGHNYDTIGRNSNAVNYHFDGIISEIRISNSARSGSWIKATYYSNFDNLLTFSYTFSTGDWSNKLKLTIPSHRINTTLYNFPVLIYLSDVCGLSRSDMTVIFDELVSNSNRKKIAITTEDYEKECFVEIDYWNDSTEEAFLWTKVPEVSSSSDTVLYLHYDSTQSDNTSYVGDTGDTAVFGVMIM
jgi:hypothetical protein